MPISVLCPNGHKLTAKEKLAGKRVKCPKCGSVVQIPELELPELDEGLVLDEAASQAATESDPLASMPSSAAADDPLGLGTGFEDSFPQDADPLGSTDLPALGDDPSPQVSTPSMSASPYASVQPASGSAAPSKREFESKPAAKLSLAVIIGIAGGGIVLGLMCMGVVGWLLFSGSSTDEVATTDGSTPPAAVAPTQPAQQTPSLPESAPELATSDPTPTSPPVSEPEPTAPTREPLPFELVRIDLDKRLDGFKLPGPTWASAYDETSGRLAITNDEQGVLIYDLDEIAKGNAAPVATIPTKGLPTAVCLKPLPDQRAFVIAGQDAPELLLIDADSLEPIGRLVMSDLKYIDFLTGSDNPDDPFVYYSTHGDNNKTADRLGRVDLLTGAQDNHTQRQFVDLTVSPDGQRLYTRGNGSNGVIGAWSDILKLTGNAGFDATIGLAVNYAASPVSFLGDVIGDKYSVLTPLMTVRAAAMDYTPRAAFQHRPVLVGISKGQLVFGSANHYQRLASIPLPPNWFVTERWHTPNDFRARHNLAPDIRTAYLDFQADSTRETAVITFSDHLVVAPLSRTMLPSEPSLLVKAAPPEKVVAGELVEVELDEPAEGVVFEYVPNTDWLPNEKMPLLGLLPPGEASPRSLELGFGFTKDSSALQLKSYEPLRGFKMPFKIRIGNEVIVALKYEGRKLVVKRTNPVDHGFSERIEVVDDEGRILTKAEAASKPLGKQFFLAAAMNNQQTVIYVSDLRPIAGNALPATLQIGDERMTLVSVDDFKTALNVTRTEPVSHSVSSEAWLLEEADASAESGPNLPVVQGRTFRWTPSPEQLGKHTIRMRAKVGKVAHEWFWNLTVEQPIAQLPFQVVGIEPERGTRRAVVWGQKVISYLNPTTTEPQPNGYYVGVYDLAAKNLLVHKEVAKPIGSAVLHGSKVYASLIAYDIEPKADRQAENERQRAMSMVAPTQIVRFDAETLEIADQVAVPAHSRRLEVIADRYLAAYGRDTYCFNIGDLTAVEPHVGGYEYPTVGRLRNRWVWEGVVWDEAMKVPQLLLYPVHFEQPPGAHSPSQMFCASGGTISMSTQGPHACTWFPINSGPMGQRRLQDFPGSLSCANGSVDAYSWASPSTVIVGGGTKKTSVKLLDINSVRIAGDRHTQGLRSVGHVTEADGEVHVALLGKLYSLSLDKLIQEEEAFRFVEQQEKFVLEAGKPAKLSYSAPDAVNYELQVWYQRPHFHDEQPNVTAKSLDGTFDIAADALQGSAGEMSAEELKQITPAFKRLTGRNPRGSIRPIYISVIAEHKDGKQKAGLAHSYLVEFPKSSSRGTTNRR